MSEQEVAIPTRLLMAVRRRPRLVVILVDQQERVLSLLHLPYSPADAPEYPVDGDIERVLPRPKRRRTTVPAVDHRRRKIQHCLPHPEHPRRGYGLQHVDDPPSA